LERANLDHYATLGLERRCTASQIHAAYRALTKKHHPDVNPGCPEAVARTQAVNAAHEILGNPARRLAYDRELDAINGASTPRQRRSGRIERNISQDVQLRVEDFLRGTALDVRVADPANPRGVEVFHLDVPPGTAPGARFRLPREEPFAGGTVTVRVKVAPGFRFKASGSNLRCDLRINAKRAEHGGTEMIQGAGGKMLQARIPAGVGRGAVLRIPGEGLPKPGGGRGDLLVRITYRPEVRISRKSGH
jgi:DnaJ-class molecular chaperone